MDALDVDTLGLDDLVLPLHSQKASLATVGGKGANLSQLVRAGFPVPTGFLVSTAAYRAFVQDNGLQQQIVIDAAWGLGEGIVSGLVTPDHLIPTTFSYTLNDSALICTSQNSVIPLPETPDLDYKRNEYDHQE